MFFAFVLLFQTLLSSFAFPGQVIAAGADNGVIKNVTLTDADGDEIVAEELEETTDVNVVIDWSVAGADVEAGVPESISLSEELSVQGA
jgi:hypothetical protein